MKRWAAVAAILMLAFGATLAQERGTAAAPSGEMRTPADFVELTRPLLPAVVNVSTERTVREGMQGGLPFPFGPPFAPPDGSPRRGTALGSGFIIDPQGYVVTNDHVIADAQSISVILHDERRFDAKVVGRDPRTDIALLKIEAPQPLPHVRWGDSEQVEVGQWVLAIGNPYGLGGSVTSGIISAKARSLGQGPYDAFLQTDAAINQGNSGGPLFNARGEVIGINTAIFSPTGGNVGIGFAVPSTMARNVVDQLRTTGQVRRGWLGVQIQQVTPDVARALGLDQPRGALVANVIAGTPAAQAGLRTGDVIVAYRGKAIQGADDLPRLVAGTDIGSKAELTVLRDGKQQPVQVQIAELPRDPKEVAAATPGEQGDLGLALAPLADEAKSALGLPDKLTGVLVQGVAAGSPAAQRGIRPGDVIVQVGNQAVASPKDVVAQVDKARSSRRDSVLFLLLRGESRRFVGLDLQSKDGGGGRR